MIQLGSPIRSEIRPPLGSACRQTAAFFGLFAVLALLIPTIAYCEPTGLRAGAAKVDITPKPGVSLDGPISKNGPVVGVHDRLHARALVLANDSTQIALVVCDACMIGRDVFDKAKKLASAKTGIQPSHMLLSATHTHAAVRATHIGRAPIDNAYHEWLSEQIALAIQRAHAQLSPARVGFGSFERGDWISCRRFLCRPGTVGKNPFGESGEQIKSVAGKGSVLRPAGPVDPQFSILSVQHADGSPLAVLGNYSVHYCGGYRRGMVSADYFGQFADSLESRLRAADGHPPFIAIMSNATSGNTGAFRSSDGVKRAPFEWMKVTGRYLAERTFDVVGRIKHEDHKLAARATELMLGVRRPNAERIAWAKSILQHPPSKTPHRWSKVYAQEALHLQHYKASRRLTMQAIRIGDVGIAGIPCEVFAETGLKIKADSPHKHTFTIELANGYGGYLPPPEQHRLGGYETWPARSSFLEVDAEPKIRAAIAGLLSGLVSEGSQ